MQSIKENKHLFNNIQVMFPLSCKSWEVTWWLMWSTEFSTLQGQPVPGVQHCHGPPPSLAKGTITSPSSTFSIWETNCGHTHGTTSLSIQCSTQGSHEQCGYLWVDQNTRDHKLGLQTQPCPWGVSYMVPGELLPFSMSHFYSENMSVKT